MNLLLNTVATPYTLSEPIVLHERQAICRQERQIIRFNNLGNNSVERNAYERSNRSLYSLVGFISCLGAKCLFRKYDRKVLFLEIDCLLKLIGNYCLQETKLYECCIKVW